MLVVAAGGVAPTSVVATNLLVQDVQASDCLTADCPENRMAVGIGA